MPALRQTLAIWWRRTALLRLAPIAVSYAGALCALYLIKTDGNAGFQDATSSHLPLINWFIEHGYTLSYPALSTTAPGFHWLVAFFARAFGIASLELGHPILVLMPALLSLAFLLLAFLLLQASGSTRARAYLLLVPVASSQYFWWGSLYPVTESLALIGYSLMALAAARPVLDASVFAFGGAIATFARQIFWPVSTASVLCLGAAAWWRKLPWPRAILGAAVGLAPATLILALLVLSWGGLIPAGWDHHKGRQLINTSAIAHGVMLVGLLGLPFVRLDDVRQRAWLRDFCLSLALAAVCWLAIPLGQDADAGRWGSVIWRIANASPAFGERPLLLAPLLTLGFQMLFIAWRRAQQAGITLAPELVIFAAYLLALGGQAYSWQRYFEVPSLLFLTCSLARARSTAGDMATLAAFLIYFVVSVQKL
jgi:hypothetical protein